MACKSQQSRELSGAAFRELGLGHGRGSGASTAVALAPEDEDLREGDFVGMRNRQ